jgi:mRNA interferase MazF
MKCSFYRGELYYANLDPVIGSEQGGERPVVILQNNKGNHYSPTVIVAPLTTKIGKPILPTHVEVNTEGLRSTSIVLLEQIKTIDKQRIIRYIGMVSQKDMRLIDQAILVSLEISRKDKV